MKHELSFLTKEVVKVWWLIIPLFLVPGIAILFILNWFVK